MPPGTDEPTLFVAPASAVAVAAAIQRCATWKSGLVR